jgi:hypothetical protein
MFYTLTCCYLDDACLNHSTTRTSTAAAHLIALCKTAADAVDLCNVMMCDTDVAQG